MKLRGYLENSKSKVNTISWITQFLLFSASKMGVKYNLHLSLSLGRTVGPTMGPTVGPTVGLI